MHYLQGKKMQDWRDITVSIGLGDRAAFMWNKERKRGVITEVRASFENDAPSMDFVCQFDGDNHNSICGNDLLIGPEAVREHTIRVCDTVHIKLRPGVVSEPLPLYGYRHDQLGLHYIVRKPGMGTRMETVPFHRLMSPCEHAQAVANGRIGAEMVKSLVPSSLWDSFDCIARVGDKIARGAGHDQRGVVGIVRRIRHEVDGWCEYLIEDEWVPEHEISWPNSLQYCLARVEEPWPPPWASELLGENILERVWLAPRLDDDCSFCLEPLSGELRVLDCLHVFHARCLLPWITLHFSCPLCLRKIQSLATLATRMRAVLQADDQSALVELLCQDRRLINHRFNDLGMESTCLHLATAYKAKKCVRTLLLLGAEGGALDRNGFPACAWGQRYPTTYKANVVRLLDQPVPKRPESTSLHAACIIGDLHAVYTALDRGANVNSVVYRTMYPLSPFLAALQAGQTKVCLRLAERGVDPDFKITNMRGNCVLTLDLLFRDPEKLARAQEIVEECRALYRKRLQ